MKNNWKILLFCLIVFFSTGLFASEKPIIGITPSFSNDRIQLHNDYVAAIVANGGVPMILPPCVDEEVLQGYVDTIDAAVFSGGMDIPPEIYGQKPHYTTQPMAKERSDFEQRFISRFLATGKPALGICLGMQFSNVVRGGTMIQDIPSLIGTRVPHRNGEMYTNLHSVGISRGSLLEKILGTTSTRVISRHHQAVDKIGQGLSICARSSDGIIEALERNDGRFGLFVQWHPESMKDVNSEHRDRLFKALIEAARQP